MNRLFNTLFTTLRARMTRIWTKIRFLTNPTYWHAQIFSRIRRSLYRLFDVKPRHKRDYYSMARWLVSRRLAFAIVVALAILCAWYITTVYPNLTEGSGGVPVRTFKYDSVVLKFYEGKVRILAEEEYVAYEGWVGEGESVGSGKLFDIDGNLVYEGNFTDSMFNGTGTSFYPTGITQYEGNFVDNLYQGTGAYYHPTGSLSYEGAYVGGLRHGIGTLYNAAGAEIFTGNFQKDALVYSEFLAKAAADVAGMYTGESMLYVADGETCVAMEEISAVYTLGDGVESLDQEWTLDGIYVMESSLEVQGQQLSSVSEVTSALGEPSYYGTAYVTLAEAVSLNLLAEDGVQNMPSVEMSYTQDFVDLATVSDYEDSVKVYIYSYESDGLVYTLYTSEAGVESFSMYAITLA